MPESVGGTLALLETQNAGIQTAVEMELAMLRRQGGEMDKSELVNSLLNIWVKWRKGKNSNSLLDEISPRRKGR